MNSENNKCAFCGHTTSVNRQYLHAKNKPSVGSGFVYIYYCNDCGLKEYIEPYLKHGLYNEYGELVMKIESATKAHEIAKKYNLIFKELY